MSVIYTVVGQNAIEHRPDYTQPLIIQQPPLPTVAVEAPELPSGFIVINASDFDPAVHVKYTAPSEAPSEPDAPSKKRTPKSAA